MQQGEIAKLIWSMQADLARALPKALTQTSVLYHVLHSTAVQCTMYITRKRQIKKLHAIPPRYILPCDLQR